ncbi:MAG: AAA family ATPase [Faecousia sp.]
MRIITISREFGSGGRELGKRLADILHCDYYDKEIITAIACSKGLDEGYVARALDKHGWQSYPLTYRRSLSAAMPSTRTELLLEQKRVIEEIARAGKDCVIVGRNADVLLRKEDPFNIFVCADMEAKIRRCMERAPAGENLSRKEMERRIRGMDRCRAQTRELLTGSKWGDRTAYHLMMNTTDWSIKELAAPLADFAACWFRRTER